MKTRTTLLLVATCIMVSMLAGEMHATGNASFEKNDQTLHAMLLKKRKSQGPAFGIQGGIGFSSISGDWGSYEKQPKIGIHLGAHVNVPLASNLSFRTGLSFVQKGQKLSLEETNNEFGGMQHNVYKSTYTASFLEIPLMLSYNTDGGFYISGGPYLGILTGFKQSWDNTETFTPATGPQIINEDKGSENDMTYIKPFDLGLNFQAGINLESGLGFSAGFAKGFSRLNKEYYEGANEYTHSNFKLAVSYTFHN